MNEPTEAQVEAAARAFDPEAWAARDKYTTDGTGTQVELDLMVEYSLGKARAALEAAARAASRATQGAAPQAECDCGAGPGSAVCKKVCATRAPVLPSSGVDEEKLAEVIEQARDRSRKDRDITKESLGQYIARAVAEWLKGQGR